MRKIKWLIRSFLNWVLNFITTARNLISIVKLFFLSNRQIQQRKILLVSIKDFNNGRYGFQLLNYFSKADYHIVFFNSNNFLLHLYGYDRLIFKLPAISLWRNRKALAHKEISWICLNKDEKNSPPVLIDRKIELDFNYFQPATNEAQAFKLPYYVHPLMNQYITVKREIAKTNRVIFYGQDDLIHDQYFIEEYFKKISRKKVFEFIQASGIDFVSPDDFHDLIKKMDDARFRHSLFFIDSKKIWIPAEKWIEILGRFNFFIATPGVCMPVSHNVIEAMSVGTVPILQYPELFSPALKDSVDCIVFDNLPHLTEKIMDVLEMPEMDMQKNQENVQVYFKQHISPQGFLEKIESHASKEIKLYMNAEQLSLISNKKVE